MQITKNVIDTSASANKLAIVLDNNNSYIEISSEKKPLSHWQGPVPNQLHMCFLHHWATKPTVGPRPL